MTSVIRFENVSKRYNLGLTRTGLPTLASQLFKKSLGIASRQGAEEKFIWALKDVCFELEMGQSMALIGPNGAGKSTILKLLANITKPTSGRLSINGRLSALIELGAGFHPDLTGRENIYLNGIILGLKRNEVARNFDEIVAFSELERFIDTPVKRYSSGMTVRLGFAVAACIRPDILLVDEVLAVGDTSFRQKCTERIQSLLTNGTSIIFVSHSLSIVQAICPSAVYLKSGQIVYRGKTTEVIEVYERDIYEEKARKFEGTQPEDANTMAIVQVTQIEVLALDGQKSFTELHSDQSVEICIHYEAYQSIETANATVLIVNTDGLICCAMRTSIDNIPLSLQQGKGTISVILDPLQLVGGMYNVEVRLTNVTYTALLATGWSQWFFVSDRAFAHEDQRGVFEPRRRWEHHPASLHTSSVERVGSVIRVDSRAGQPMITC